MREAYIVKGFRTAIGKAPKGFFKFKRPDELAAETIEFLINSVPDFDKYWIDDLIVGNAAVSYTHLTLPTKCWVYISVVGVE